MASDLAGPHSGQKIILILEDIQPAQLRVPDKLERRFQFLQRLAFCKTISIQNGDQFRRGFRFIVDFIEEIKNQIVHFIRLKLDAMEPTGNYGFYLLIG